MSENQPLSGKIIGLIQDRYIQQRIEIGTAFPMSSSELVLSPLRTKGLLGGLSTAWREARDLYGSKLDTSIFLSLGAAEFFLIATGVRICKTDQDGNWEPFKGL